MAKRRDPAQKEYNPLDDARGRLPIELELVREVIGEPSPAPAAAAAPAPEPLPKRVILDGLPDPLEARPKRIPQLERLTKYNKFLTTPTEKLELERLAARISGALGVSVRPSHLIRACLIYLLHAENEIVGHAERQDSIKRPSNTESVALAEFDQMIAGILSQAFRQAKPIGQLRQ